MPKLWAETIDSHRKEVREVIADKAARLVADRGLRHVTMGGIAEAAGISRATLYKYFRDVEEILASWHASRVGHHLQELASAASGHDDPRQKLHAVLKSHAHMVFEHHRDGELVMSDERPTAAKEGERSQAKVNAFLVSLIKQTLPRSVPRPETTARELSVFVLHALAAAAQLRSRAEVDRLVERVEKGFTDG